MINLNPFQLDALREIGSMSAGSAATALAHLINQKVKMSLPEVITLEEVSQCCSYSKEETIIMHSKISNGLEGKTIFTATYSNTTFLLQLLLGSSYNLSFNIGDEMVQSSLKEVGMMVFGSYVKVLGEVINRTLLIKPPQIWTGKKEESTRYISEEVLNSLTKTLCFKSFLWIDIESSISFLLIFIPHRNYINILLRAIGIAN